MVIAAAVYSAVAIAAYKWIQPDPLKIGAFVVMLVNTIVGSVAGVVITIIGAVRKRHFDSILFFFLVFSNITSVIFLLPAMLKEHDWMFTVFLLVPLLTLIAQLYYMITWLSRRKELQAEHLQQ